MEKSPAIPDLSVNAYIRWFLSHWAILVTLFPRLDVWTGCKKYAAARAFQVDRRTVEVKRERERERDGVKITNLKCSLPCLYKEPKRERGF